MSDLLYFHFAYCDLIAEYTKARGVKAKNNTYEMEYRVTAQSLSVPPKVSFILSAPIL